MLDITKPMQFRDPNYGTVIDVVPNPNGEKDSKLIVNFIRGKIVYTAFRQSTGRMEVGEMLYGDVINVPEKRRFEYWVYYFDNGYIHAISLDNVHRVGQTLSDGITCIHIEHVVRELNA